MGNKRKYVSEDARTGHDIGEMVELSYSELNVLPFNVNMKLVEPVDDKDKIIQAEKDKAREELRCELSDKGLSNKRVEKILSKYDSVDDVKKSSKKLGIDTLTDEFIAKEYSNKTKGGK